MNKHLIVLSISGGIHFTKTLCQEKERCGCQLSLLAEKRQDASNIRERNDDLNSDDKYCSLLC